MKYTARDESRYIRILYILIKLLLLFPLCILYKQKNYKLKLLHKLTTEHTLHGRVKSSITQNHDCCFS